MTPLPPAPSRLTDPVNFASETDALLTALPTFVTEVNALQADVTAKQGTASTAATTATNQAIASEASALAAANSATLAQNAANYKGDWVAGYATTGYSMGMSVSFTDGQKYVSKIDNNLTTPITLTNTAQWDYLEAVSPAELALKLNLAQAQATALCF